MKLQLQRETLLKPLQSVIGVVERKQTMPILSNVLLHTLGDELRITGTDLEIELIGQSQLEKPNDTNEQFTLPARKLIDICKALPEGAPIELYQEKNQIILRSERSRFTLSSLPAEEFPNFEESQEQISFVMDAKILRNQLQRTHFAMAQQDVRYYLNGMLFEIHANTLRTIATDGHRFALNCSTINQNSPNKLQIILPRKGVLELMRLLDICENDEQVTLIIGSNYLRMKGKVCVFTSRLIEARFPDYNRVIPKNADKQVLIERDLLKQALMRTAILCNEKLKGTCLEFRSNMLRIYANNMEHEAAQEEIPIDYTHMDIDLAFNVNYLLDTLNCLNPGLVKLAFTDGNSGFRVEEEQNPADSIFIVMPMKI